MTERQTTYESLRQLEFGGERRDVGRGRGAGEPLFQFQQLTHEAEVGRDDGTPAFHVFVRVDQTHVPVTHEVGDGDGRRARDPRLTMDQDVTSTFTSLL